MGRRLGRAQDLVGDFIDPLTQGGVLSPDSIAAGASLAPRGLKLPVRPFGSWFDRETYPLVYLGLVALVVITGTLIGLRYDFLSRTPETRALLWTLLGILGFSIASLFSSFVITGFKLLGRLPAKFPGREKLIELSTAYHLYARHWGATATAFALSIVAHLATFTTFLFVAYAFRAPIAAVDFFAIMPIERTISSLPISFAGVGVREHILQVMLGNLTAVPPAVAVLIGSMSFFVTLICAAPGGIVYLLYRPSGAKGAVSIGDMEREVADLDHGIIAKAGDAPAAQ